MLTDEESPETSPLRDPFPPRQMISLQDQHPFFWPRRLRIKANEGSRLQPRTVWTKTKYRKEGSCSWDRVSDPFGFFLMGVGVRGGTRVLLERAIIAYSDY